MSRNGLTGNAYSDINVLILWDALIQNGYAAQCWMTFKQALALGGAVRKGEHGTTFVYADHFTPKAEREKAETIGDDPAQVAFLKRYTVFNHAQCEFPSGVSAPIHGFPVVRDDTSPDKLQCDDNPISLKTQSFMRATGADIRIGGDRAFYVPSLDYIQLPPLAAFTSLADHFSTVAHECSHWSGATHRLNRDSCRHGKEAIAREELIAEITSAFLCATFGIEPTVRHADYVGSWLHLRPRPHLSSGVKADRWSDGTTLDFKGNPQ